MVDHGGATVKVSAFMSTCPADSEAFQWQLQLHNPKAPTQACRDHGAVCRISCTNQSWNQRNKPGKPLWSLPGNPPLLQALLPAKPRLISFAGTTFDELVSLVRYKRSRQNQLP